MRGEPNWDELDREAVREFRQTLERLGQRDWRRKSKQRKNKRLPHPGNRTQGLVILAAQLGISRQAIALWRDRIPIKHVPKIAAFLRVPKKKLRPGVFARRKTNGKTT